MITEGILNAQLAKAVAGLRHKDRFVISDAGLPVPEGIEVIDLSLTFGVPRFKQILDVLAPRLIVEEGVMSAQAEGAQPEAWLKECFPGMPIKFVKHDGEGGFKDLVHGVKFVVHTGETTSYSNIILRAGWPFEC